MDRSWVVGAVLVGECADSVGAGRGSVAVVPSARLASVRSVGTGARGAAGTEGGAGSCRRANELSDGNQHEYNDESIFTLTGAALSHAASGDPVAKILVPLGLFCAVVASWVLRPGDRALVDERLACPVAA